MYAVIICTGHGSENTLYTGSKKECEELCDSYNWEFVDQNGFEWHMEVEKIDGTFNNMEFGGFYNA